MTAQFGPVALLPMARKLRVEYPGAIHHVMTRGDRREPIFRDDEDRRRFLATLGEAREKAGWQVHALGLMLSHFHLVVGTPLGGLVAGMKWFAGTMDRATSADRQGSASMVTHWLRRGKDRTANCRD